MTGRDYNILVPELDHHAPGFARVVDVLVDIFRLPPEKRPGAALDQALGELPGPRHTYVEMAAELERRFLEPVR